MYILIGDVRKIALKADIGDLRCRTCRHGVARNINCIRMRRVYEDADAVLRKKIVQTFFIKRLIIDDKATVPVFLLFRKKLLSVGADHRRSHIITRRTEAAHNFASVLRTCRREYQSPGSLF